MFTSLILTFAPIVPANAIATPAPLTNAPVSIVPEDFKDLFKEAGKDAEKLWALYEWTLEDDKRKKYRKRVLGRLVKEHPDHRGAREALGHVEYEGEWYESQRDLDKAMAKVAKEKGLVKFNDKWVERADVPYMKRGYVKDESGDWYDPVAKKRKAEGWKQQDLVWIEPDEISKMEEGLWKCDQKWFTLEEANHWHNDPETPWRIPTDHAVVWSTASREVAEKAGKQAEAAFYDMQKIFGFGGELRVPFMVLGNQREYLRFMDGDPEYELPQIDPFAISAMNRAAFADLWFDFDAEEYRGMGVTFWDAEDQYGDNYGIHDARFAYGLSFVESIDPSTMASEEALADGEVSGDFLEARMEELRLPPWFRWGAASYASRWFRDNTVGKGGDPFWARKWSAQNLASHGGPLPMDDFFEFVPNIEAENTTRWLNHAGMMIAFLVDGPDKDVNELHTDLQRALEKGEDVGDILDEIRSALSTKEEQIRAFAGL